jgi:hypothetical protein
VHFQSLTALRGLRPSHNTWASLHSKIFVWPSAAFGYSGKQQKKDVSPMAAAKRMEKEGPPFHPSAKPRPRLGEADDVTLGRARSYAARAPYLVWPP